MILKLKKNASYFFGIAFATLLGGTLGGTTAHFQKTGSLFTDVAHADIPVDPYGQPIDTGSGCGCSADSGSP